MHGMKGFTCFSHGYNYQHFVGRRVPVSHVFHRLLLKIHMYFTWSPAFCPEGFSHVFHRFLLEIHMYFTWLPAFCLKEFHMYFTCQWPCEREPISQGCNFTALWKWYLQTYENPVEMLWKNELSQLFHSSSTGYKKRLSHVFHRISTP